MDRVKTSRPAAMIPGQIRGSFTRQNTPTAEPPRSRAAPSSAGSNPASRARTMMATYDTENDTCAATVVQNPRSSPIDRMNVSMAAPITTSGTTIGRKRSDRVVPPPPTPRRVSNRCSPSAAVVPTTTAAAVVIPATKTLVQADSTRSRLRSAAPYHLIVNPRQAAVCTESLNEYTTSTAIGAYRNTYTRIACSRSNTELVRPCRIAWCRARFSERNVLPRESRSLKRALRNSDQLLLPLARVNAVHRHHQQHHRRELKC